MMPWSRQVVHVLRQDICGMWPFILLYVGVLSYGALQARGMLGAREPNAGPLLFYGGAMLLAALLVHRQSPAAPVAHWNTLPYDRSAVWAAKWSLLVVLLVCAVVAVTLAVHDLPLPVEAKWQFVTRKAGSLFAAIVAAALVASLASELRTVSLLLLALPLASTLVALLTLLLASTGVLDITGIVYVLTSTYGLFAGCVLAMVASLWLYQSRTVSREVRVSVSLGAVLLFFGAIAEPGSGYADIRYNSNVVKVSSRSERLADVQVLAQVDTAVQEFTRTVSSPPVARQVRLYMTGGPTSLRAQWVSGSVRVSTPGVSIVSASRPNDRFSERWTTLYEPALPITPSPRWLGATNASTSLFGSPLDGEWLVQADLPSANGVEFPLYNRVQFSEPVVVARVPLSTGARENTDKYQFRLLDRGGGELICAQPQLAPHCGQSYPDGSILRVELRSSDHPERLEMSFALVNASRREAVRMTEHFSERRSLSLSQMFVPDHLLASRWLLAPVRNTMQGSEAVLFSIDDEWLRGAELVVVEWVPAGDVSVTIANQARAGSP